MRTQLNRWLVVPYVKNNRVLHINTDSSRQAMAHCVAAVAEIAQCGNKLLAGVRALSPASIL